MPPKFHLVLLIHAHQPEGNFEEVLERAYRESYLPFAEHLKRHPAVRLGLHYSGPLLEWIERNHPEFFELLRELAGRGQTELMGGGHYEPVLISIPPEDQQEQMRLMTDYLERHFGQPPAGAWLAERVWEPQLPSVLARAGIGYTLVDDIHFLSAGFEPGQLFGTYVAEDAGKSVVLFPGLKPLRYLIPFRTVEDTIAFLRESAAATPGGMAAMGDDCEKFGVWPGTFEHCYGNKWLEHFFSAVEENADWLATTPPQEYLAANRPLGRADLPAASYSEMMEWVLPTRVRRRYHAVRQEFAARPEVEGFLHGGAWRGFFTKYAESNLLHKKMLCVSRKLQALRHSRRSPSVRRKLAGARRLLLRAQCNDAYWHGIFGGLYAPHLRTELWKLLIRAETVADGVAQGYAAASQIERLDFDADGAEELYCTAPAYAALGKPSDGGTLAALDFRPCNAALVNSIQRRPEAYHDRLHEAGSASPGGVASIHEQTRVKEKGLERHLRYDRWARHAFRLLLFPAEKTHADYEALRLEESAEFAGGAYEVVSASPGRLELAKEGRLSSPGAPQASEAALRASKTFTFSPIERGFEVSCEVALAAGGGAPGRFTAGIEVVVNLLAPMEPDRYIESGGERHPLDWSAAAAASELRLVDGWQKLRVTLASPNAQEFWIAPIETVSESEEGFERVYQGSQILTVWPVTLEPRKPWSARLILRAESL
ncbi:MAG TPA: alpha-amylase/4-alpha-glucanotransferase domain-containing protein [Candidatus Acidoferrales bacterium]